MSPALALEYEAVLKREASALGLRQQEIDDFLDGLFQNCQLRPIFFRWRPVLPDPEDDHILELAVAARCDFVVTYDLRDFRPAMQFGIEALCPKEFLERLGESR